MPEKYLDHFSVAPGAAPEILFREMTHFCHPRNIITLHPFTRTDVNGTLTIQSLGGRPCVGIAGAGAQTDGSNLCWGVAAIRPVAGKQTRLFFGVRLADATNQTFVCGLNIVATTITANMESGGTPSTDYFLLHKTEASLIPRIRSRKASGTEESHALSLSMADATWFDFEILLTPDASTAGAGRVQVYARTALATPVKVLDNSFGAAVPDTVSLALCLGCLAGDTGVDTMAFSHAGIEQQA